MADRDETLVVPVNVDALVVNESLRVRGGQGFRRWQPNFNLLRHNRTPEPDPFTNDDPWNATQEGEGKQYDGVYVRWELPEALRRGASRTQGGRTEFPLVPNRWLVVRYVKDRPEHLAAWVVESDFLDPEEGTSRFVHPFDKGVSDPSNTPFRSTIITTKAGRALGIGPDGTEWHEPTEESRKKLFLTAVGPGLMTFHAYQPYHQNVFSFHDPLTGIDLETVDYQVVGWYSDAAQEEVRRLLAAPDTTVEGVLAGLGWTVNGLPQGWTPGSTTYCGRVAGVAWDRDGAAPDSDRPGKSADVTVAVGSSADEAHAALTPLARAASLPDGSGNAFEDTDHALLHALTSGLADTLDGPDGTVRTAQELHKGWFSQVPGGYVWRLADSGGDGNASGDPKSVTWSGVSSEHEQWLAGLNTRQRDHDTKVRELAYLQQRLYALWWMHGLPLIPRHFTREQFRAEIDRDNPRGLAAEVAQRKADLTERESALTAYAAAPPKGCELRRETLPPFWQVTDPSVVLSGTKGHAAPHAAPASGKDGLPVRLPGQITGGVPVGGQLPAPFAALKAAGLPPVVPALLGEFLEALGGKTLPEWRQPWKPLLYQWQVQHWNVPYEGWEFDGTRYQWLRGEADKDHIADAMGRRFLVPLIQHNLNGALERHGAAAEAGQAGDLDLLSQKLDGLTGRLACRDTAPNLSPPGEIGDLIGDVRGHLPHTGPLPVPFEGWLPSGFAQIRAGQFAMAALSIVDEFGQTLDVLLSGDKDYLRPVVGDSLLPGEKRADDHLPDRFVQLPPRLLQPARLRFDFVDERQDDKLVDLEAGTTPVCAWIIPSYVDRSLLCYAPDGTPLGELRLKLRADASSPDGVTTVLGWDALPDSSVRTLDDLAAARPQLYAFLRELVAKGPDAFADLLSTVDRSLTGIDPGNPYGDEVLGALLGRPLALVRARLGFELDGPPAADPGWQYALDWRTPLEWDEGKPVPPQMAHLAYQWPVRLGNAGQRGDGLIGYFTETDYTAFHAVATPDTERPTDYVSEIGEANWPRLAADSQQHTHLTLLLDPQAAVHATTDLLPVTELRLPARFTRNAMAALKPALRLSPVLTTTRKLPAAPAQAPAPAPLALPHPTSPQGTWDWAELTVPDGAADPQWAHQPIVQIDQKARLDEDGPVVRTGFLRLTNPFDGGAAQ
ncbi:hypothetical protein [Streptomyces sp. NPDC037389]|uniref:hypothetical protein n=1 Tax=Streptomyces sp. NPDC037389 TaxID=3155369 RepID=UPI0033CB0F2C